MQEILHTASCSLSQICSQLQFSHMLLMNALPAEMPMTDGRVT